MNFKEDKGQTGTCPRKTATTGSLFKSSGGVYRRFTGRFRDEEKIDEVRVSVRQNSSLSVRKRAQQLDNKNRCYM